MFNPSIIKGIPSEKNDGGFVEIKVSDIWDKYPKGEYPMKDSPSLEKGEEIEDENFALTQEIAQKKEELLIIEEAIEEKKNYSQQIVTEALEIAESIKREATQMQQDILIQKSLADQQIAEQRQQMLNEIEELKQEMLRQIEDERVSMLREIEPSVAKVIKEVINHIVSDEIYKSTEWIQCFVKKSLLNENIDQNIKLIVSTHNFKMLTEEADFNLKGFRYKVEVIEDATLTDCVCCIETTKGSIEYNISKGLEQVLKEIDVLQQLK